MTKIQITQKHIDRGFADDCRGCPTARAINDIIVPHSYAVVRRIGIYLNRGREIVSFNTPFHVFQFIESFDRGEKIEPLEFELDIPEDWLRK